MINNATFISVFDVSFVHNHHHISFRVIMAVSMRLSPQLYFNLNLENLGCYIIII